MRKAVVSLLAVMMVLSMALWPDVSKQSVVRAQEEAPQLRRLRPKIITAGTQTFTMRIEGRGFVSGSNILFDGVPLASPRINPKGKLLLAEVDASLIAAPGEHSIQVLNPDGISIHN
jgi:hypothetical protein